MSKKKLVGRGFLSLTLTVFMFTTYGTLAGYAMDPLQKDTYQRKIKYYNVKACGSAATPTSPGVAGSGSPTGAIFPNLPPGAMAVAVDKYIEQTNPSSKLSNLGETIVAGAQNSNINPFLIVAIAQNESSLAAPDDFNIRGGNNAFGRSAIASQPHFDGGGEIEFWYKWTSMKASVDHTAAENQNANGGGDIAAYIRDKYGPAIDAGDMQGFVEAYVSEGAADNATYLSEATAIMDKMVQLTQAEGGAGSAPASAAPVLLSGCACSAAPGAAPGTPATGGANGEYTEYPDQIPAGMRAAARAAAEGPLKNNIPVYKAAASRWGIPWQAIAATHFRESNNNPKGSMVNGKVLPTEADLNGREYMWASAHVGMGGYYTSPSDVPGPHPPRRFYGTLQQDVDYATWLLIEHGLRRNPQFNNDGRKFVEKAQGSGLTKQEWINTWDAYLGEGGPYSSFEGGDSRPGAGVIFAFLGGLTEKPPPPSVQYPGTADSDYNGVAGGVTGEITPGGSGTCTSSTFSSDLSGLSRDALEQKLLSSPHWKPQGPNPTNDVKNDIASDDLVRLLVALVEDLKVDIRPSVIKTGHSDCSAGGSTSNHYSGLAADLGNAGVSAEQMNKTFVWLYDNRAKLKIDELIYEPVPSGGKTLDSGVPFVFDSSTRAGHKDHIHVSVNGDKKKAPGCT